MKQRKLYKHKFKDLRQAVKCEKCHYEFKFSTSNRVYNDLLLRDLHPKYLMSNVNVTSVSILESMSRGF